MIKGVVLSWCVCVFVYVYMSSKKRPILDHISMPIVF